MTRALPIVPLVLMAALLGVRPAAAQYELTWDQCPGSFSAKSNKAFACNDDNAPPMKLVIAFTPPKSMQRFVGYRVYMEISTAASTLPDWWALGPGDCREGALTPDVRPGTTLGSCSNPWDRAPVAAAYSYFERGTSPSRGVYQVVAARTNATSINVGTRYFGSVLTLSPAHSNGSDGALCAGCASEVCISVTQVELNQELAEGEEVADYVTMNRTSQPNVVTFNARDPNGNPCGATNRTSTWGKIKTTYR